MLQLLFEFIFGLVSEIVAAVIMHIAWENRHVKRIIALVAYATVGAIVGWLTLLAVPYPFIHTGWVRAINLVVSPLAVASFMTWIGRFRSRRGKDVVGLETFFYAYVFALALALARAVSAN